MFKILRLGEVPDYIHLPGHETRSAYNMQLSLEMGKAGSLTFTILPTHPLHDRLNILKDTISVRYKDKEIWRGRIITANDTFDSQSFTCEGALNFLNDIILPPEITTYYDREKEELVIEPVTIYATGVDYVEELLREYNNKALAYRKFESEVMFPDPPAYYTEEGDYDRTDFNSVLYEIDQVVSNGRTAYNGYFEINYISDTLMRLVYVKEYFTDIYNGEIDFGKNLIDYASVIDGADIFTALRYTSKGRTEDRPNPAQRRIVNDFAVDAFGVIERAVEIDEYNQKELDKLAKAYLDKHVAQSISVDVSAIDLSVMTDSEYMDILVGHRTRIKAEPYNLNMLVFCSKIVYDLSDPSKTKFTFGSVPRSLTDKEPWKDEMISEISNIL